MFNKQDSIHFSCTQCGKCCDKSPNMHFYDMINLSEEFFFQTAHHGIISYEKKPLEKELLRHYQSIGHTIMMPEIEASLFYFIDFTTVNYPSYKSCSKLNKDNTCSIYNNRPSACQLAPLDYRFEDNEQWRTLNFYKKQTVEKDWKCDFSENSPIVFNQEQIYSPHYNSLYFQSVQFIRDFTDEYVTFIGLNDKDYQTNYFKALYKSVTTNNLMISDIITSLQVARYNNKISEELAVKFMENQIAFLEKEMKLSFSLKIKNDLQTSRLYKRQKEDYIKALKNNVFSTKQDSFDIY